MSFGESVVFNDVVDPAVEVQIGALLSRSKGRTGYIRERCTSKVETRFTA